MEKSDLLINKMTMISIYELDKYYAELLHAKKIAVIVNDADMIKWCDKYMPLAKEIELKCKNVDQKDQDDVLMWMGNKFVKVGRLKNQLLSIEEKIVDFLAGVKRAQMQTGVSMPQIEIPEELKDVLKGMEL